MRRIVLLLALVAVVLVACGSDGEPDAAATDIGGLLDSDERTVSVLETSETVIGQSFSWPDGPAEMTSVILTMQPGEETGPHYHEAPLFAVVLEGTLQVDYGDLGTRTYTEGMALMEALDVVHNGTNVGDRPLKLLIAFAGAEGVRNTVAVEE